MGIEDIAIRAVVAAQWAAMVVIAEVHEIYAITIKEDGGLAFEAKDIEDGIAALPCAVDLVEGNT